MNYEKEIASGLVEEILNVVYKYSESMTTASAIGCLEIAKQQIFLNALDDEDEEDD